MALDLTAIRKAVASQAAGAAGLTNADHFRPDGINGSPHLYVMFDSLDRSAMAGASSNRWTVLLTAHLSVEGVWDRSSQERMDTLIPLVWAAMESDRTLGGNARHMQVTSVANSSADGPVGATYQLTVEV